jgi:hypothetical protein
MEASIMDSEGCDIPLARVVELVQNGSPPSEIADYLGVSESVIRDRFAKEIARSRAIRRIHLRGLQWKAAAKGSVNMLILLGKDELGQGARERVNEEKIVLQRLPTLPEDRIPDTDPTLHADHSRTPDSALCVVGDAFEGAIESLPGLP